MYELNDITAVTLNDQAFRPCIRWAFSKSLSLAAVAKLDLEIGLC